MKYRRRDEVIRTVLTVASKGPVAQSKLMYGAYLGHGQTVEYISFCLRTGLMTASSDGYSLTERGLDALKLLDELEGYMRDVQVDA